MEADLAKKACDSQAGLLGMPEAQGDEASSLPDRFSIKIISAIYLPCWDV